MSNLAPDPRPEPRPSSAPCAAARWRSTCSTTSCTRAASPPPCSSRTPTRPSRSASSPWPRPCRCCMGGLDLSVGAVMTLTNCIASELVDGSPARDRPRHGPDAARRLGLRADERPHRRLRPHPADHHHARHRRHRHRPRAHRPPVARRHHRRRPVLGADQPARRLRRHLRPRRRRRRLVVPALRHHPGAARPARRRRAARLDAVPPLGHRAHRLRHRLGRGRRLHVRPADRAGQDRRLHPGRLLRRLRRALPRDPDLLGQRRRHPGRRLHAQLDRRGRARRHLAPRRHRRRHRLASSAR